MNKIESADWTSIYRQLNEHGYARIGHLLSSDECQELIEEYGNENAYRSVINMERYRFGKGQYKYFSYPLPELVQRLRAAFYPKLKVIANEWMSLLGLEGFPETHDDLLQWCHQKGQRRPTPLILKYEAGGFNTLHQDLYGDVYFPFQVVIVLTEKNLHHEGGELVFVEQIPRAQSKAEVVSPYRGDAIIFTTNFRPVKGTKGYYRAKMKHGVSPVTKGNRLALGIIFHDAL